MQIRDKTAGVHEALEAAETHSMIMAALDGFDTESKNVIVLRDMQGFEYDEISAMLGIPLGSVKSRLNRARLKLREIILKRNGDKL